MQIKNFAAQACRDLSLMLEAPGDVLHPDDREALTLLIKQVQKSVHFALPDYGRIFDDDFRGLHDMELRLPYPSVTLEYTVPSDAAVDHETTFHSPRRLVLAREVSESGDGMDGLHRLAQSQLRARLRNRALHPTGRGILVWGATSVPESLAGQGEHFSPELCMWLIPERYPNPEEINQSQVRIAGKGLPEGHGLKRRSGIILGDYLVALRTTARIAVQRGMVTEEQQDEFFESISADIAQEAAVVLEFIEAASCSNIVHEVSQAAPKPAVAARRARDGKLPIYEVRTLSVSLPGTTKDYGTRSAGGGARQGPRQHLRRGHIRRLESGKRVWVQSAVVGTASKGVINKSYEIRAA